MSQALAQLARHLADLVAGPWVDAPDAAAWSILMAALVATACGWLGCYLVLQGNALLGDAISHTAILGIVVAFLVTGSLAGGGLFLGAVVTAVLTAGCTEALRRSRRVDEDAALGIVFTTLFALGVVLLNVFASRVHLDTSHALYGDLAFALAETWTVAGIDLPAAVLQMAAVTLAVLFLIVVLYKELLLVSFDPLLAGAMGWKPGLARLGMLVVVSVVVMAAFSSVGAILVVAMLVTPAATASLLSRRLVPMLAWSTAAGWCSALVGYHLAWWLNINSGAAIVCVATAIFFLAVLLGPRDGLIPRAVRRWKLWRRRLEENVLRALLRPEETDPAPSSAPHAGLSAAQIAAAHRVLPTAVGMILLQLAARGLVARAAAGSAFYRLTPEGHRIAERQDRAHRLWETFLVQHIGLAPDHVHATAEEVEHLLSEGLVEQLDDLLGHPELDPHGSPIPRSLVSDQQPGVFALSKLRVGDRGRIVGLIEPAAHRGSARTPTAAAATAATGSPESTSNLEPDVARHGLPLGAELEVIARDPASLLWSVRIDGDPQPREIPHAAADRVLVHRRSPPLCS